MGRREDKRRRRNTKLGEFQVGEGADGVFVLSASHTHVDPLRAHGFQLRAGLGYVGFGADAALQAALGQVELVFQVGNGSVEQLDLGVEAAQLEVVDGHFCMKAEVDVCTVGGAGLGVGAGCFNGAADAAPEVRLPTGLAGELKVALGGGVGGGGGEAVCGD